MKAPKPTERHLRAENARLRAALQAIDRRIAEFDRQCSQEEYTNTGEAWEVLWTCRGKAAAALHCRGDQGGAK